jgi:pimeloyl-ACP methyl ester carboxylesterase
MVGTGKMSWRTIGGEIAAAGTALLSMPLRWLVPDKHLDRMAPDAPPVVFVHGFLGDPTNFMALRRALAGRSFASFAYRPRLHFARLAAPLAELIEGVCAATGADRVDVVGHSLGGLIARHLVDSGGGRRLRRLVTLGAPYYLDRFWRRELAIFAAHDPLVASPPCAPAGRTRIVPDCGHLGLLYHPTVLHEVAAYLGPRAGAVGPATPALARAAA